MAHPNLKNGDFRMHYRTIGRRALSLVLVLAGLVLPYLASSASAAPAKSIVSAKGVTVIHYYANW